MTFKKKKNMDRSIDLAVQQCAFFGFSSISEGLYLVIKWPFGSEAEYIFVGDTPSPHLNI